MAVPRVINIMTPRERYKGLHSYLEDWLARGGSLQTLEKVFGEELYFTNGVKLTDLCINYMLRKDIESLGKLSGQQRLANRMDDIGMCEDLVPPRERGEYIETVCDICYHQDKVHRVFPMALDHLFRRYPYYRQYYKKRHTEDIKANPSVAPMFGCVLL